MKSKILTKILNVLTIFLLLTIFFISCNPMKKDAMKDFSDNIKDYVKSNCSGEYF